MSEAIYEWDEKTGRSIVTSKDVEIWNQQKKIDALEKELQSERDKSQQLAREKGDMRIEIQDLKRKIEATLAYQELLLDAQEEMEKKLQAERDKSKQQFDIGYKHGVREGRGDFKSDLVKEKEAQDG